MSADTAVKIECIHCGRTFKTWQGLGSHYHHRHEVEQGCPICVGGMGSACYSHFL